MNIHKEVMRVLKETSRTFYIPVSRLPSKLQETVAAAYLCMRAIDEIEDHEALEPNDKAMLLRNVGLIMQSQTTVNDRVLFELDAAFNNPYLILSVPLYAEQNERAGLLQIDIQQSLFNTFLSSQIEGIEHYIYKKNRNSSLLIGSEQQDYHFLGDDFMSNKVEIDERIAEENNLMEMVNQIDELDEGLHIIGSNIINIQYLLI